MGFEKKLSSPLLKIQGKNFRVIPGSPISAAQNQRKI